MYMTDQKPVFQLRRAVAHRLSPDNWRCLSSSYLKG